MKFLWMLESKCYSCEHLEQVEYYFSSEYVLCEKRGYIGSSKIFYCKDYTPNKATLEENLHECGMIKKKKRKRP